jgi:hypothetical protein
VSDQPCACLACQIGASVACATTEKRIRADQRRLDLRELQATARDLNWLLDQLHLDQPASAIDTRKLVDNLDKIHRHTRRLITLSERRQTA